MGRPGEGPPSPHVLSPPPASAQHPSREMGVSCGRFQGPRVSGRGRGEGSGTVHSRPLASIPLALAAGGPALRAQSYTIDASFFGLDVVFNKYFLNVCYVLGAGNTGESMWTCP